jgi:ABC-type siderophore export system fused ATPase/permease subunit
MMRDLARTHERGVVVVSHDSRVIEFADRIVHMEDGRISDQESEAIGREGSLQVLSMEPAPPAEDAGRVQRPY